MKQRIRLTENQLHNVIKESVKRILNEIKYKGVSFHGNNPYDWGALRSINDMAADALLKTNDFEFDDDYLCDPDELNRDNPAYHTYSKRTKARSRCGNDIWDFYPHDFGDSNESIHKENAFRHNIIKGGKEKAKQVAHNWLRGKEGDDFISKFLDTHAYMW